MNGMRTAAALSLGGLVLSLLLYSYFPLPATDATWDLETLWRPILLLGIGLTSFVVLLVTGMVVLLNLRPRRED